MALSVQALTNALIGIATAFPGSYAEAGQRWAAAYGATYAANAQSLAGGSPVGIPGAQAILASSLAGAFASGSAAAAMAAAFIAFWGGPPMAFLGAFPGIVTAVGGTFDLAAAFQANIDSKATVGDACARIAGILDASTRLVIVTDSTTPSPTIGPIS